MVDPAGSRRKVRTMSKKMMLLAAGALAALAITALPGAASAKETKLDCLTGTPCTFTVAGGVSTISTVSGDTISCTSVTGSGGAAAKEVTTFTVSLKFHGCKETTTIFKFACTSPGQPSGTIVSNTITGHLVALEKAQAESESGILLTDAKTTFTCAGGFARTTVTGNIIGENESKCGAAASATQKWNFAPVIEDGKQIITKWTGKTFNLIAATNHNETPTATSGYETAAKSGTTTLTWNQNVQVTCAT
jgi:hypothetical protein